MSPTLTPSHTATGSNNRFCNISTGVPFHTPFTSHFFKAEIPTRPVTIHKTRPLTHHQTPCYLADDRRTSSYGFVNLSMVIDHPTETYRVQLGVLHFVYGSSLQNNKEWAFIMNP
jgi:hypothetical protein